MGKINIDDRPRLKTRKQRKNMEIKEF